MHEFAIATSLVEALNELVKEQSARKVLEVHLRVGKLRVLSIDQLKFSYGILSKGTALEGSVLDVEETPGYARCTKCHYAEKLETDDLSFHFSLPQMTCPQCGVNLVLEGGDECLITRVRMIAPSASSTAPTNGLV
ncbi:MAG: hydrogenase maturation nickel metallochaperone HypA [Candidatus Bathyarchaeia archaeon]